MFKVWVQDSLLGWAPLATHYNQRNDAAVAAVSPAGPRAPRERHLHLGPSGPGVPGHPHGGPGPRRRRGLTVNVVDQVRAVLTPGLLKPGYRRLVEQGAHPMTGHCYVASEALYALLGGKAAGYKPASLAHEGSIHWWLVSADGQVIDPTADQFTTPVPYENGRCRGFLTREPSARAREVLRRVAGSNAASPA